MTTMEKTDLIYAVADCTNMNVNELNAMSQTELVEKVILPRILGTPRGNFRYNRIEGRYMQLIADYGKLCVELDRQSGELLMEFAMQRISKGAVLHEGVHLINILPEKYQKYTSAYDEPGIMGPECWNFLLSNLVFCVKHLKHEAYRDHAEKILWGLLEHLNPDGTTNNGYLWNDEKYVGASKSEAYQAAEQMATCCFNINTIAQHFASDWRKHKAYLKRNENVIDWKAFFAHVDLEAENFYTGIRRTMYQYSGLYKSRTEAKILKEIHDFRD